MTPRIDILALGLASPLGLSSRATIAAMRAGLIAHEELDEIEDLAGDTVTGCRLAALDVPPNRIERACFFAAHALVEVWTWRAWIAPPAVFLIGPESDRAHDFDAAGLWASLARQFGGMPLPATPTVVPHGRAGLFHALALARDALAAGVVDLALVGGADSLVTSNELRRLVRANALLGKANPDGLIPGEGAAFFLLGRGGDRAAWATIEALALGHEDEPYSMGGPPRAAGLSRVFAQLRTSATPRPELVVSAQPHQRWWSREFSHAYLRNAASMPEPLVIRTPSAAIGDLGATAGGLALGVGVWELHPLVPRRGASVYDRVLVYGCADEGALGACMLRSPRTNGHST